MGSGDTERVSRAAPLGGLGAAAASYPKPTASAYIIKKIATRTARKRLRRR